MAVILQMSVVLFQHFQLVRKTNSPVVVDGHVDTLNYYNKGSQFSGNLPFTVTINDAIRVSDGSKHFGYAYLVGTLFTLTSYPMLAMRALKILLFFSSLSCVVRLWRTEYGERLAIWGFIFMGIIFTPAIYYHFRNLKDSVTVSLFMFIMVLLETLLRPKELQLNPATKRKTVWSWILLLILLYMYSTLRLYHVAIILAALGGHIVMSSKRIGMKGRLGLMFAMLVIFLIALKLGMVTALMEQGEQLESGGGPSLSYRSLLQAFLSPMPWGEIRRIEPLSAPFYWLYWLLLPYTLLCLIRHIKVNFNWKFFVYMAILAVVGVATGDPPRKRLIVFPILVGWVLSHKALKRGVHITQTNNTFEQLQDHTYEDYENIQGYWEEELVLNTEPGQYDYTL
ncbi:hypothetical protein KAR91_11470 [Candidatus Pacearchaeota archaeon]|nr:hypothetical protein [Candidatus Pacearchaeota archaeon]